MTYRAGGRATFSGESKLNLGDLRLESERLTDKLSYQASCDTQARRPNLLRSLVNGSP